MTSFEFCPVLLKIDSNGSTSQRLRDDLDSNDDRQYCHNASSLYTYSRHRADWTSHLHASILSFAHEVRTTAEWLQVSASIAVLAAHRKCSFSEIQSMDTTACRGQAVS
jgi:hypothetical protein